MADKQDKVLRPLDWIYLLMGGIVVVALMGMTFSNAAERDTAIEKVLSTEGCTAIGVSVDWGSTERHLRTIYTCADGRMVIK